MIAGIAEQLHHRDQTLDRLMGGKLDATKTISCFALFEAAGLASAKDLLNRLGRRCSTTQALINGSEVALHP